MGCTVKLVLSGLSKIDKTKILMTNGSLMAVESIAECSLLSALENFDISSKSYFSPYMPIIFVMQGKCLFNIFLVL